MALIVSESQTKKLIDMPRALKLVDKIFRDRAAGKVRNVPRRRLKGSSKQLNMMAAWQSESDLICLRAYAGGSNTVTLYNGRTGQIDAIIDMGYLSSLRTGAATGVAATYLAPADARTLGIVGPGWQATFQVEAVTSACPIERVVVFGRTPKRRKEFIRQMAKSIKAEWREAASVEEVEAEADILVVSTDSVTPVVNGTNLKDEVLVASMGANSATKHEISNNLIRQMSLIVTDDVPTAKVDSGDLIASCEFGITRWDSIVPLERIVAGGGPQPRPKKILFQSNGIADEDLAVGRYVLEQAKRKRVKMRRVTEI
jgi:ornithine cyclodeaminase/alanine dehydrogenase-like protein (mu-crystallin family)